VPVAVISRMEHGGNCGPVATAEAGVGSDPGGCVEMLKLRLSGLLTPGDVVMNRSTV
jgi:hypothetical protein